MGRKAGAQFLGYKFSLGMVMSICHAPIDFVTELIFGEKSAWSGQESDATITIDKKDLFGGKDKEGGVAGAVSIHSGRPTQEVNPYVAAFRGETSAQRGLLTLVFGNQGSVPEDDNAAIDWDKSTISEEVYRGILISMAKRAYGENNGYKWQTIESDTSNVAVKVLKIIAGKETGEITDDMLSAYLQEITSGNRQGHEFKGRNGFESNWNRPENNKDPLNTYRHLYGTNKAIATGITKVIFVDTPATVNEHGRAVPNGAHSSRFPLHAFFGQKVRSASPQELRKFSNPFYWGNTPYFKPVWIRVQAIQSGWTHGLWYGEKASIDGGVIEIKEGEQTTSHKVFDMNPAHIIYKTLTNDDWGMGYHPSDLDDASFRKAADKLYAEGFGMSILWDSAKTIEDFNAEILDTIDGVIRVNVITGKFELILIRNDYNVDELPVLDENSIVEIGRFERSAWGDGANEIVLTYKDRNESDVVLVKQNLAAIEIQRGIISSSQTFKGVHTKHVAELIAERELKLTSSSIAKMSIKINRLNYLLQNGDVFVLKWKALGIEKMVCRVASIVRGEFDDGVIEIEAMEDVFGLSKSSYTATDNNANSEFLPQLPRAVKPIQNLRAIEASYHDLQTTVLPENLNSVIRLVDGGSTYMLAMAEQPSAATVNYDLYASNGSGGKFQKVADDVSFNPTFRLLHDVDEMIGSFGTYGFNSPPSEISEDMYIIIGDECMGIEAISPSGVINVKRGILDTLPQFHAIGDVGYIVSVNNAVDRNNYAVGSTLTYKTVSQGISSQTSLDDSQSEAPKLIGRAARPAPVNTVRINDMFYPTRIDRNKPATITWQTRNRKQMIPKNVFWNSGSVTPEEGQTTNLRVFDPTVEGDAGVIYELKNTEFTHATVEPIPKQAVLRLDDLGLGPVYHYDLSKESKIPVQGTNKKPLVVHSDDVVAGAIEGTKVPSLGLNNYIEIPFDDALNSNTLTVIARVKLTANSTTPIFTIGRIGDDVREPMTQRFALAVERGLISVSVGGDSPAYLNGYALPSKPFDGDFHDVAVTLDLNEGRMEAFLDGVRLINKETPLRFPYNPSGAENLFSIRSANTIARSRTDDFFGIGENQLVSDIIGVSPNTKYSLSAEINTQKDNGVLFYQIYDANKRPIGDVVKHTSYALNSSGLKECSVIFTTPANAKFIRVGSSHLRNGLGRLMFAQSNTKPEYNLQERDQWLYELPPEFPAYLGVRHTLNYDSYASRDSVIHDFVLYNRVLSAAEIRKISNRITRRAFPTAVGFELETMRDNLKSWQKFRWIVETAIFEED
jgi:hypothetical protein